MSPESATLGAWLRTDRLLLRRPGPHDVRRVFEVHGDLRTYRHHPEGRMHRLDEATSLLDAWLLHWDEHGFGYATVEAADGSVIGFAGAKHQQVAGRDVFNLYYRFAPGAWGNGYASECTEAVVAELAERFPTLPALARVATNNPSSIRVAERVGLVPQDLVDPLDPVEHLLYASMPLMPPT